MRLGDEPRREPTLGGHLGSAITGLAAVLAALVVGYFTASASRDAAEEETARVTDQRAAEAKGAARILISELLVTGYEMIDWAADAYMKPFGPAYPIAVPKDDLKLVASRLLTDDWRKVNVALSNVEELRRYVLHRSAPERPLAARPLSRQSIELVARDAGSLADASFALTDLAEMDDIEFPTLDPDAMFQRVREFARDEGLSIPR